MAHTFSYLCTVSSSAMSDFIHHECGIAFLRLLKTLKIYLAKYGNSFYGLNKMHLLMQKQHNRGQDGAGIAVIKFDMEPGSRYIQRIRSNSDAPIKDIFSRITAQARKIEKQNPSYLKDTEWLKYHLDLFGNLYLGHLRYGTFGGNTLSTLHPLVRENNWKTKNLVLAGNFNLTNVDDLFQKLIELGQCPVETSDTITIIEKIGHFLDEENEEIYQKYRKQGYSKYDISGKIARELNIANILKNSASNWDGGYVIAGMIGHGDGFVMRDPNGIRPAFYYHDDEVVVATSERPAIQTTFNIDASQIREISPGHALIVKLDGTVSEEAFTAPAKKTPCSFERIYFSRGTDVEIYQERKKLGQNLTPAILEGINYNLADTVFAYIPNTAIDAYYGMVEALTRFCDQQKFKKLIAIKDQCTQKDIEEILNIKPRIEKAAVKDIKLRTFITQDSQRDDLAAHVYDITYGSIIPHKDTLVVLDDSIVRGTTLKQSIFRILDRLHPKKIIIASSAPQIRYPDCYGIDMAKLNDFIAFRAAIELLKENHHEHIINEVYNRCKAQEDLPAKEVINEVKAIYKPFSANQLSEKIAALLKPSDCKAEVQIIYQTIEDLHDACPNHQGDWYFTGDYPTPGGNKVANRSFINYIEGKNIRAY